MQLGNQTLWNLYVLSFGSYINLNDINLITTEIIGTGEINLGDNLNSRDISKNSITLPLTEREANLIIFLMNGAVIRLQKLFQN